MSSRTAALVVALLSVGFVIQGCGGDESAATGGASAQKTAFIKKVDAICAAHEAQLNTDVEKLYARKLTSQQTDERVAVHILAIKKILIPNLEDEIRQLHALGVPSGVDIPMEDVVWAIEKMVKETKAKPARILAIAAPYEEAERAAEKYGITRCPVR